MLVSSEWQAQERVLKPQALPVVNVCFYYPCLFSTRRLYLCVPRSAFAVKERLSELWNSLNAIFIPTQSCTIDLHRKELTEHKRYHQDHPTHLVDLQNKHWRPLIKWAEDAYGIELQSTRSIFGTKQSDVTTKRLMDVARSFDPLTLAGMSLELAVLTLRKHLNAPLFSRNRF
jgi:ATP synthase F1 complex assembly factor 2